MKKKPILDGKSSLSDSHQPEICIDRANIPVSFGTTENKKVWLDKQDVMQRMHISSRTLQKWRSKKMIPYSKVDGKIYYRESDLHELLMKHLRK